MLSVSQSTQEAKKAAEQLIKMQDQAGKNEKAVDNVGERLALLKEKIQEARDKASKVRPTVFGIDSVGYRLKPICRSEYLCGQMKVDVVSAHTILLLNRPQSLRSN